MKSYQFLTQSTLNTKQSCQSQRIRQSDALACKLEHLFRVFAVVHFQQDYLGLGAKTHQLQIVRPLEKAMAVEKRWWSMKLILLPNARFWPFVVNLNMRFYEVTICFPFLAISVIDVAMIRKLAAPLFDCTVHLLMYRTLADPTAVCCCWFLRSHDPGSVLAMRRLLMVDPGVDINPLMHHQTFLLFVMQQYTRTFLEALSLECMLKGNGMIWGGKREKARRDPQARSMEKPWTGRLS